MTLLKTLAVALIATAAATGCTTTVEHPVGKPCERCSRGYYPVNDRDHRRSVCISHDRVMNCDRIPAECGECARIQRYDMERHDGPYTR
jgi:hypothetical protein